MAVNNPACGVGAVANCRGSVVAEFASKVTIGQVERIHHLDVYRACTVVISWIGQVAVGKDGFQACASEF